MGFLFSYILNIILILFIFGLTKLISMSIKHKLPISCPSCESKLKVAQLTCETCETTVNGKFQLPLLLQLPQEEQDFILTFFLNSGSLKQMAQQMNISYPTVRNKLDDIIAHITKLQNE